LRQSFEQGRDGTAHASRIPPFDGRILPETRLSDHASFWDAGLPAAFFRNPTTTFIATRSAFRLVSYHSQHVACLSILGLEQI
jgi:hypothetical protein